MVAIKWLTVEPSTGRIIEELPGVRMNSSLPTIMGRSGGQVSLSLPIADRLPDRWELATEPFRTLVVAHYDDDQRTVAWVGTVVRRTRGSGPTIDLELTDVIGWMERSDRMPPDSDYVQWDQCDIVANLLFNFIDLYIHGETDVTPSGILRDRDYTQSPDKTRVSAAQDLSAVINGPEWCINYRWDENGALVPIGTVAQRLGRQAVGQQPETFSNVDWTLVEDYSEGKGATIVTAVGPNEGDRRTECYAFANDLINAGYLRVEYRYTPDTGSNDAKIIQSYADQKLADIKLGTDTYSFSVPLADLNILPGRDITIGDDVAVDLSNPDLPSINTEFRARMIGWVIEPDPDSGQAVSMTPILYKEDTE